MQVGIIGAGRQGRRRAAALAGFKGDRVVAVSDIDLKTAERLAADYGATASDRWQAVVEDPRVEAVVVSVPPNLHFPIAMAAVEMKKHLLVEKPFVLKVAEGEKVMEAASRGGVIVKCGFNLRFHPGIRDMQKMIKQGAIGEVSFAECRYGIGGRPGYDKEWRAYPEVAGGGELFDRGVHVVDLFRWMVGDFAEAFCMPGRFFWNFQGGMEDNGFGMLRTGAGQVGVFHVSATQWRNTFYLEVCGKEGYLILNGLGYVYGTETLRHGRREEELGPQKEAINYYIGDDRSWTEEWREFTFAVKEGRQPLGSGEDGVESLRIIHALYESSRRGQPVPIKA